MEIFNRLKYAWNAFVNNNPTYYPSGPGYSRRPDRAIPSGGRERSIIASIYNRIGVDCESMTFAHSVYDKDGNYKGDEKDSIVERLTISANIDQTGRSFIRDAVMSMLDDGEVAIIPVDIDYDLNTGENTIESFRIGKIVTWYPKAVKVYVYNELTGQKEYVTLKKEQVAIIENPYRSIMNEPNSTMQRLVRKLNVLDLIDENSYGKLDLIIALPYAVKNKIKRDEADKRRDAIINQLKDSHGIAYIDSTEKVIQLNRPVENNILAQVEYLTEQLLSQLGIDKEILDGTADEEKMINYHNRIINVIMTAFADEFTRKYLSIEEIRNGHKYEAYNDPFKYMTLTKLKDVADALTRNAIFSSNEIRGELHVKPSSQSIASELSNKNIANNKGNNPVQNQNGSEENQNGSIENK